MSIPPLSLSLNRCVFLDNVVYVAIEAVKM